MDSNLKQYNIVVFYGYFLHTYPHCYIPTFEASRGAAAQSMTVSTGCGFDCVWLEEMKYLFKFIFPFLALVSGQSEALRSPLNMQRLQNSEESVERSVLTLGSFAYPVVSGIQREANFTYLVSFLIYYIYRCMHYNDIEINTV